jgi:hypothetical protein
MKFCIFMSYCCIGRMTIVFPLSVFEIIASLFLSFVLLIVMFVFLSMCSNRNGVCFERVVFLCVMQLVFYSIHDQGQVVVL